VISYEIGVRLAISKACATAYDKTENKKSYYYNDSYCIPYGEDQIDFIFLHIYTPLVSILYHAFINKSRRSLVYHPQLVAVYHQCEVLYIIKPQGDPALTGLMIYSPKGADDIRMYISPQASYTFNDIPSLRLG
jgi:hypothetical protein